LPGCFRARARLACGLPGGAGMRWRDLHYIKTVPLRERAGIQTRICCPMASFRKNREARGMASSRKIASVSSTSRIGPHNPFKHRRWLRSARFWLRILGPLESRIGTTVVGGFVRRGGVIRCAPVPEFDYLANPLRFAYFNRALSRVLDRVAVLQVRGNPIILNYAYCLRIRRLLPRFRRSYDPDNRCDGHTGVATHVVDDVSATRVFLALVSIDDAHRPERYDHAFRCTMAEGV
jgi:hypothetical protein